MALSFKLFLVLCLSLLCCTLCVPVCASSNTENKVVKAELVNSLENFSKYQKPDGDEISGDDSKSITLNEIRSQFVVAAKGGVIVAVTEAQYTEKSSLSDKKVDVLTKYFKAEKDKLDEADIGNMKNEWNAQLATEDKKKEFSTKMASAVNANGDKIYIFLLEITGDSSEIQWDFKLVEGKVDSEKTNGKLITWSSVKSIKLKKSEASKKKNWMETF